jgi:NAD-dependent deacetylase
MKKIVVLTGAGVSAESGIPTFREAGGLWAGHDVMEVASPQGWDANPELVLKFYNDRRKNALEAKPNLAHKLLAELEQDYTVDIITQNVDLLHEQAGSTRVLHLHGELFKSRSTADENLVYDMKGWELNWGDKCELGSQLRPHIVWFGEQVPLLDKAIEITSEADIFLVIGTSMQVYPAASLISFVDIDAPKYLIDPNIPDLSSIPNLVTIAAPATQGMTQLIEMLKST